MMFNMIRVLFLAVGALLISSILASLAQPGEAEAKPAFEHSTVLFTTRVAV